MENAITSVLIAILAAGYATAPPALYSPYASAPVAYSTQYHQCPLGLMDADDECAYAGSRYL